MKYSELYVAALYDTLERGGELGTVDKTIAEINAPTQAAFTAWVKTAAVQPCSECGDHFYPDDNIKLDEEALCPTHARPT